MKLNYFLSVIFCSALSFCANATGFIITYNNVNSACNSANNGQAEVNVSGGYPPYYYSWNTGQTTSLISNLAPGIYTVNIHDSQQGDSIVSITISENKCEISAEEVFTPNGDGINDTWGVYNLEFYPDFLLLVYNRWGQKVYEQSGTFSPWDGRENDLKVPDATYYYVIYKDKNKKDAADIIKGSVTIIR